jgi:[acyl-carrier-protein] S-malonyltransferase
MKTCFLFPGQGAQHPGMAKDIYDTSQEARNLFDLASEACRTDMKKLLFESDEAVLKETRNTQIALALAEEAAALRQGTRTHSFGLRGLFGGRMARPGRGPGD